MKKAAYTFRNLFRISNIGTFVFFVLDYLVLVALFGRLFKDIEAGFVCLGLIYIGSVIFSFTPAGQAMLCLLCGTRRMRQKEMMDRILPLAAEVCEKAREKTPLMPDRIDIRVMYDPEPNAYAIGLRTICVSEGLLTLPDNEIRGILAHEIGHLALQHTLIHSLIGGGNILLSLFMVIIDLLRSFFGISAAAFADSCGFGILYAAFAGFTYVLITIWTGITALFLKGSGRANDYEADAYASELGYGDDLAKALDHLSMGQTQSTFLHILNSSHPEPADRISRLEAMGAGCAGY